MRKVTTNCKGHFNKSARSCSLLKWRKLYKIFKFYLSNLETTKTRSDLWIEDNSRIRFSLFTSISGYYVKMISFFLFFFILIHQITSGAIWWYFFVYFILSCLKKCKSCVSKILNVSRGSFQANCSSIIKRSKITTSGLCCLRKLSNDSSFGGHWWHSILVIYIEQHNTSTL